MGGAYRTRELLDQFVLPLHLARRAFAEQREEQRARAHEFRDAIGDARCGLPIRSTQVALPVSRSRHETIPLSFTM